MEGLSALFRRENPYEKRARVAGTMMGSSGFAKPFLAYAMGRDMAQSQQWDEEKEQQITKYLQSKATTEAEKVKAERWAKLFTDINNISNSKMIKGAKHELLVGRINLEGKDAEGLLDPNKYVDGIFLDDDSNLQLQIADKTDGTKIPIIFSPKSGFIGTYDPATKKPIPMTQEQLDSLGKKEEPKTPNEIELQIRANKGDTEAAAVLKKMQDDKVRIARESRPATERQPNTMIIEHPDTKQRVAIDKKNIGDLQKYLNQGYVPYSTEDMNLLREYINLTIKPKVDEMKAKQKGTPQKAPTIAPPKRTEGRKAMPQGILQGNTVIVNGKEYPLNPDGTVTIDRTTYKVNK